MITADILGAARHEVLEATTYSIRLNHRDRRLVSGTVFVRLLGDDDHGDRPEEATPISVEPVRLSRDRSRRAQTGSPSRRRRIRCTAWSTTALVWFKAAAPMTGFVWAHARGDHYRHDGQSSDAVLRSAAQRMSLT